MINRRTSLVLYCSKDCVYSDKLKMLLSAKGVAYDTIETDINNPSEELLKYNPYGSLPTLLAKDLVVYGSDLIFEYLEERFPYPALLSVFPMERAQIRLISKRINEQWIPLVMTAMNSKDEKEIRSAKIELIKVFLNLIPIFARYEYFMRDEKTILDFSITVILDKLPKLGIKLPERAKCIDQYAKKMFDTTAYRRSVGLIEQDDFEEGMME